jgi:hypothetical protein
MEKFKLTRFGMTILVILFAFSTSNCHLHMRSHKPHKAKSLPPGQAKKIHGDKSAKKYAPGQNK